MKGVIYFIMNLVVHFILSSLVSSRFANVGFANSHIAVFGVFLIISGIGSFFFTDYLKTAIALIVTGILLALLGIDGNFGLAKETLEWGFRIGY